VGGVNPAIQLAAALDRRGISVSVDLDRVIVHAGRGQRMIIRPRASGVRAHDYGRDWSWHYGDESGRHPRGDFEGAAETVETFLRDLPELADSTLLYRMDHMGWTQEEELKEALARAPDPAPPDAPPP
jgi:glycosidase